MIPWTASARRGCTNGRRDRQLDNPDYRPEIKTKPTSAGGVLAQAAPSRYEYQINFREGAGMAIAALALASTSLDVALTGISRRRATGRRRNRRFSIFREAQPAVEWRAREFAGRVFRSAGGNGAVQGDASGSVLGRRRPLGKRDDGAAGEPRTVPRLSAGGERAAAILQPHGRRAAGGEPVQYAAIAGPGESTPRA